jgi:hypothetical protein
MRIHLFALLVAGCALSHMCKAAEICPWLNAATAGGALETSVGVVVTHPGTVKEDATCAFTTRAGSATRELQIEVRTVTSEGADLTAYVSRCNSKPVALNAIGNEAVACRIDKGNGQNEEQVAGRVRDRVFLIKLRTSDGSPRQSVLGERARGVAEIVAGNLF